MNFTFLTSVCFDDGTTEYNRLIESECPLTAFPKRNLFFHYRILYIRIENCKYSCLQLRSKFLYFAMKLHASNHRWRHFRKSIWSDSKTVSRHFTVLLCDRVPLSVISDVLRVRWKRCKIRTFCWSVVI